MKYGFNLLLWTGHVTEEHVPIFKIEATINNRMFDKPLEFLAKNEDDLSAAERAAMRALMFTLKKAPQPARQAVFQRGGIGVQHLAHTSDLGRSSGRGAGVERAGGAMLGDRDQLDALFG